MSRRLPATEVFREAKMARAWRGRPWLFLAWAWRWTAAVVRVASRRSAGVTVRAGYRGGCSRVSGGSGGGDVRVVRGSSRSRSSCRNFCASDCGWRHASYRRGRRGFAWRPVYLGVGMRIGVLRGVPIRQRRTIRRDAIRGGHISDPSGVNRWVYRSPCQRAAAQKLPCV